LSCAGSLSAAAVLLRSPVLVAFLKCFQY
jgi:hypothetical protein